MALTVEEQAFFDFAKESLPKHLFNNARPEEVLGAFAKMYGEVNTLAVQLFAQTYILQATNLPPDFLNQHAIDRGTRRQDGESDASLASRLRSVETALVQSSINDTINSILTAQGLPNATIYELRPNRLSFGDFTADSGTGGEFVDEGSGVFSFNPTVPFALPVILGYQMNFTGANNAANDGLYTIAGLTGNAVTFANAGVAEVDPGVTWNINKLDYQNNIVDGFAKSYWSRNYRLGSSSSSLVIILPFGCTASTESTIREALRTKTGAGVQLVIECRQSP